MAEAGSLAGKVALVTGSSRGIGKCCALALARAGCDIVVAAKSETSRERLPGSIHDTAREVEALGRRALAVRCDVRNVEEVQALAARAQEAFGRVDILLNNAGALWWKPVLDTPPNRFDLVHEVNVRGPFLLTQALLPGMISRKWGHIINMSPPIELAHLPNRVAYMISKFGMTMLALGLAEEVREHNVAANALWPATLIESQATINFDLGGPANWRKADILADALLAIVGREPRTCTGRALIDEDVLREAGVTDFARYACVTGSEPMRLVWDPGIRAGGRPKV